LLTLEFGFLWLLGKGSGSGKSEGVATMQKYKSRVLALMGGLLFLAGTSPAWAHSFSVTTSFDCLGGGGTCPQETQHEDASPYKGWANLSVTNTGTDPWGDFHFELFQVTDPITNVFFQVDSPNEPTSNRDSLTWAISGDGHTLDLYFYGDPVYNNQVLNVSVYTNNAINQVSFFGTLYYPTPVPEPGTAALLGFSLLGLLAVGRRVRRR
jgi:hypothetical protein